MDSRDKCASFTPEASRGCSWSQGRLVPFINRLQQHRHVSGTQPPPHCVTPFPLSLHSLMSPPAASCFPFPLPVFPRGGSHDTFISSPLTAVGIRACAYDRRAVGHSEPAAVAPTRPVDRAAGRLRHRPPGWHPQRRWFWVRLRSHIDPLQALQTSLEPIASSIVLQETTHLLHCENPRFLRIICSNPPRDQRLPSSLHETWAIIHCLLLLPALHLPAVLPLRSAPYRLATTDTTV